MKLSDTNEVNYRKTFTNQTMKKYLDFLNEELCDKPIILKDYSTKPKIGTVILCKPPWFIFEKFIGNITNEYEKSQAIPNYEFHIIT